MIGYNKIYILPEQYHSITMKVLQVRLPKGLEKEVDKLIKKGYYTNRSDLIRNAIRKLVLEVHKGKIQEDVFTNDPEAFKIDDENSEKLEKNYIKTLYH